MAIGNTKVYSAVQCLWAFRGLQVSCGPSQLANNLTMKIRVCATDQKGAGGGRGS